MCNMERLNFTKWFRGEIAVAFSIGGAVAGAIIFIMSPINNLNTQMAVINNIVGELKSNDLVHIELKQTEMTSTLVSQQTQITDINNKVIEILTILKKK